MPTEDEETKPPEQGKPLPKRVERALADARDRARDGKSGGRSGGRWLALVPVIVGVLMFFLMMPRSATPEEIPLPQVDGFALRAVHKDDAARASAAREKRLPGEILEVGTALRALNKAQVKATMTEDVARARSALDDALRGISTLDQAKAFDGLRTLRAAQLEAFLEEVRRFEATGQSTPELEELGGPFIDRMTAAGWIEGRRVVADEAQRRAAFKLVWTAMIGGEGNPVLAVALDEQRALYTLYLTHPHASESQRSAFDGMRRAAANDAECLNVARKERFATEQWRVDKVKKLGEIDPAYPTAYALGVAYFRAGRYDQSMESFRSWIAKHPDGPLALRARNHLKAALAAYGPS